MDVIAANSTEDKHAGIQVWLGNGNGEWAVESGPTTLGRYMDVAVADLKMTVYRIWWAPAGVSMAR